MAAILSDDIFRCIFLNGNDRIHIKISLKFVLKDPVNNISALVQIMAWHLLGDKPLSEPMLTQFNELNHYMVIRIGRFKLWAAASSLIQFDQRLKFKTSSNVAVTSVVIKLHALRGVSKTLMSS